MASINYYYLKSYNLSKTTIQLALWNVLCGNPICQGHKMKFKYDLVELDILMNLSLGCVSGSKPFRLGQTLLSCYFVKSCELGQSPPNSHPTPHGFLGPQFSWLNLSYLSLHVKEPKENKISVRTRNSYSHATQ